MKKYLTEHEAIIDLHEKGYSQDFQLFGNELLWLQEKIFISSGEFSILEYHRFSSQSCNKSEMIVFGVIALYYNVKGILINHYSSYDARVSTLLSKERRELFLRPVTNGLYKNVMN